MDIDNFEWWYSEGEAPDEEWDEPAPRDVSSDEDETGNDAAVEPDAASDAAEPGHARRAGGHVHLAGQDPAAAP